MLKSVKNARFFKKVLRDLKTMYIFDTSNKGNSPPPTTEANKNLQIMKTTLESIKSLFTSNFTTLKPTLFDMNVATLKVNASFEYEGEFTEPELIVNVYNNVINEEEVTTMIQMFEDDMFEEVNFKKENDDYIITAGCYEAVYSLKLQILRIN